VGFEPALQAKPSTMEIKNLDFSHFLPRNGQKKA